jgi:hypothetical protein
MSNTGRCRHLIIFCGRLQRPVSDSSNNKSGEKDRLSEGGFLFVQI